jgi:hypothetical protein
LKERTMMVSEFTERLLLIEADIEMLEDTDSNDQ